LVKQVDAKGSPGEVGNVLYLLNILSEFWLWK
jgi:hypothetical protein